MTDKRDVFSEKSAKHPKKTETPTELTSPKPKRVLPRRSGAPDPCPGCGMG